MTALRTFLRSCVATPLNIMLTLLTLLLLGWRAALLLSARKPN